MRAWLQLIRVPNLLTVPGDVIAGFLAMSALTGLHCAAPLYLAVAASLLLYIGGLITNDICDAEVDRRERPNRPLPSGRISIRSASIAAICCFIFAIVLPIAPVFMHFGVGGHVTPERFGVGGSSMSSSVICVVILVLVLLYNLFTKHIPVLGITNMALCRFFNVLLGSAAGGLDMDTALNLFHEPMALRFALLAPSAVFIYILSLSMVAKDETSGKIGLKALTPALVIFILGASRLCDIARNQALVSAVLSCLCILAGLITAARSGWKIYLAEFPAMIPKHVGYLVSGLIPIQAFLMLTAGESGLIPAAVTIVIYPLFFILSRKFYAS